MPFGIASAPEEWQRRHEIIEGLPGVEVIADDMVYGCGGTTEEARADLDAKLTKLFDRAREVNLKTSKKKL